MKKIAILAMLALVSCSHDDNPIDVNGRASFAVSGSANWNDNLVPDKLVLSVEDANGKTIFNNRVVDLTQTNGSYSTDAFQLANGEYRITKYLVISGTQAAYVTPRASTQKASLVDSPLPLSFTVVAGLSSTITPKIVGISPDDAPQSFGYGDFGYDTPGNNSQEWISVRVKLDALVGNIFYPDVDAIYTVHAFDESNGEAWTQDYNYTGTGPIDLRIKNGFHHYSIEAKKWGQTITQLYPHSTLYERRVREGEVPVTQVFQIKAQPKKVATTVSSWTHVTNGQSIAENNSKIEYQYVNGRVSEIKTYLWSNETASFVDQSRSEFIYRGDKVLTIASNDLSGYAEDNYSYGTDGNVAHIQHKPSQGVITDVDVTYSDGGSVKAAYKFSNGGAFDYQLVMQSGNNRSDKTTRFGELCSTGNYSYDKNVNPLAHLGYIDYLFRNYSINNRITENADYVGCAFPSLVAESYSYVYDSDGYPLKQVTNYKGTSVKTIVDYSYVDEE